MKLECLEMIKNIEFANRRYSCAEEAVLFIHVLNNTGDWMKLKCLAKNKNIEFKNRR